MRAIRQRPVVIGIAGRAGSGKTTCATWMESSLGAKRISFAEPLKRLAIKVFRFSDKQVFGTQLEKETMDPRFGFSPREALIRLGHSAREELGHDVWVRAALEKISGSGLYVIEDLRYPNEADAVATSWDFDGYVIRLKCPNADTAVDPNAPSEAGVDQIPLKRVYEEIDVEKSPGGQLLLNRFSGVVEKILSLY